MKLQNQKIDLTDCSSCVSFHIRKAMRVVSQQYDKTMAVTGLRATQFSILTILSGAEYLRITELAELLIMDRTTLSRNLKPLENSGYLEVLPGLEDRRSRRIQLTRAGKKVQKAAMPYWQKAQHEMVEYLGENNAEKFILKLRFTASWQD